MSGFNMERLKRQLDELRGEVLLQEETVAEDLKQHFGDKPKYVLFLSASDGNTRAFVCKGIANSMDTSWKNAADILVKHFKNEHITPVWLKADIVYGIKQYAYDQFMMYVNGIKTNYFREGISLDPMFNTAFLEQEVNANVFIHDDKETRRKEVLWKNINFYMKRHLGLNYKVYEELLDNVYTFKTIGFFHDGVQTYRLNNEWLNNGRRYIESIDKNLLFSIVQKSSTYLAGQIDDIGKFRYGYFTCFDKEIPGYNILRHASTTYSMIEAFELTRDPDLGDAIKRSLNFLVCFGIEIITDAFGKKRGFLIERTRDNEIKLGANAAAILAFSKYTKVFGDSQYLDVMRRLADGIDYFQDKTDGSFVHVLNFPDLSIKEKTRIVYYDGEAAFSLLRLYELDPDEKWINTVELAFNYFIKNRYWRHHDHWLSYCSNELIRYRPDKKYVDFNLKNASGILDFCLTRETTYPTLLELLMATYNLVTKLKKEGLFLEALEAFDQDKLIRAIEHRVEHQLNGLFFPEVAMYYKAPHKILWAFYIRHHSFRARIDDIEHNISGYCSYYHQILEASDKPLNSTVEPDRTTTLPDNGLINAKTYLRIPTPYGRHSGWSGADNQATHPSIVQFERPWNGYKYWMAFTPYPFAYLSTENPCIAASNDGIKWEVPPGITNPIISEPNLPNSYNSDTHLFFNDMTSMLELWYREISNKEVETLFRVTSPDGSSWTEPESMMAIASKDLYKAISPSILFENGLYKMWVMRDWIIHYAESSDGQSWGEFSPVTSNGNTIHSWHPNVIKLGSIYYLLNCDKNTNKGSGGVIKYAISDDGIHFSEETQLLTYTGNEKDINGYGVCRPSIVIEEHKVMVYYSTFSHNDEWRISVTVGQNLDRLIGIDEQVLDAYNDL